jgi:hypothetical protein
VKKTISNELLNTIFSQIYQALFNDIELNYKIYSAWSNILECHILL